MTDDVEVHVGQIWKERDKRFDRYVLVLAIENSDIVIGTCSYTGTRLNTRKTRTRKDRWHRGFKLHKSVV